MTNSATKILVTGATGLLGSYLTRYLLRAGKSVRAIKRASSDMRLLGADAEQVEWFEADLMDLPAMEEALDGISHVYHCAAIISLDPKQAEQMRRVNVEGTAILVDLCLDMGIQKLVHVSSIAALGRYKNNQHVDESVQWQRSPFNSNYAISKYQAEQEVWRGSAEGLNVAVINPSVIIGSGFWDRPPTNIFTRYMKGMPFYSLGATGFVDVRDVALSMIHLMDSERSGERYIINGDNWSYQQFFNEICEQLGKKKPHIKVGKLLGAVAWRAEWLKCLFTRKAPFVTKEAVHHASRTFSYDNRKSIEQLDLQYRPIKNSIAAICNDLKQAAEKGFEPRVLPLD